MRALVLAAAVAVCGCNYMRHPTDATTWGQPAGAMRLGVESRGGVINVFLQNRSAQPQRVVAKGFTLTITPTITAPAGSAGAGGAEAGSTEAGSAEAGSTEAGSAGADATKIVDATNIPLDRADSFETLQPGESLAKPMSTSRLHAGTYTVTASYRVQATGAWWTGSLTAGPITLVMP